MRTPPPLDAMRDDAQWLDRLRDALDADALGTIGRFQLRETIGRGGQAWVYRAWDPATQRSVALKAIRGGTDVSPAALDRARRELAIIAALDHPAIVALYDAAWLDDRPVLVLPWIDGTSIAAWARDQSASAIVAMVIRVGDGVQHAHQRGVIHCDLTPANIMIDGDDHPRILDFGLAALLREDRAAARGGTPAYAAPEQQRGVAAPDVRTDVFALGRILHTLVPHAAQDADLRAIVQRATHDDPDARYQSVDALRLDLARWRRGDAVTARPLTAGQRARRAMRRHPRRTAAAAVVLATITALNVALAASMRAERAHARDARALHELSAALFDPDGAVFPAHAFTVEAQLDLAAARLATLAPELAPPTHVRLLNLLAERYGSVDLWMKGERFADEACAVLDALGRDDDPERVRAEFARARAATFRRDADAVELQRRVLERALRVHGAEHLMTLRARRALAHAGMLTTRLADDELDVLFAECHAWHAAHPHAPPEERAMTAFHDGMRLRRAGRFAESAAQLARATATYDAVRGAHDYRWLLAHIELAAVRAARGDHDGAARGLERALARARAAPAATSAESVVVLRWMRGELALARGDRSVAATEFGAALTAHAASTEQGLNGPERAPGLAPRGLIFEPFSGALQYADVLGALGARDDARRVLDALRAGMAPDDARRDPITARLRDLDAADENLRTPVSGP